MSKVCVVELRSNFLMFKQFWLEPQNRWHLCCLTVTPSARRAEFLDKLRELWMNFCRCKFFPSAMGKIPSDLSHCKDCYKLIVHQHQWMGTGSCWSSPARELSTVWLQIEKFESENFVTKNCSTFVLLSLSGVSFRVITASVFRLSLHTPLWQFESETSSEVSWREPEKSKRKKPQIRVYLCILGTMTQFKLKQVIQILLDRSFC